MRNITYTGAIVRGVVIATSFFYLAPQIKDSVPYGELLSVCVVLVLMTETFLYIMRDK